MPAVVGRLLYPGFVAVLTFAPMGLIGPMAFAIRGDMDFPVSFTALTFALFFIASAVGSSSGSIILTRVPVQSAVRWCLALSSLLCIAMGAAGDGLTILIASALAGLVNGLAAPGANLMIVQTVPTRHRGLGLGVKVAAVPGASSLAAFAGYAIVSMGISWRMVYFGLGACGLAVLVGVLILRRFSARPAGVASREKRSDATADSTLLLVSLGGFLAANGTAFYAAFLVDALIASSMKVGTATLVVGLVGWVAIAGRLLAGAFADAFPNPSGQLRAASVLLLSAALGMVGLAASSNTVVLIVSTVASLGLGWTWPGLVHYATLELFPTARTRATSLMQTGNYAGTVTGALIFGFIAEHASFSAAWLVPIASVLCAATLMVITAGRAPATYSAVQTYRHT